VLAFFSVQAIFAGGGLNTASRLLSRLIAQHHPAIKRLFAKGARTIGGTLKIDGEEPQSKTDCWRVFIRDDNKRIFTKITWIGEGTTGEGNLSPKGLPLPVLPATQEILGLGNVSLILSGLGSHHNHEVCFILY
jgi:hypothetical protein